MKELNLAEGYRGENLAKNYLLNEKRYTILAQNYRNTVGEIDIIARDKNTIVFVEVKARETLAFGRPSEAVNYKKQQKIRRVAELYLVQRKSMTKCQYALMWWKF